MISPSERSTRYGVEIKPPTLHVECEKLDQVLVLLEGHTGAVRVFDRYSHQLVVDGTVQDAQKSLGELAGRCQAAKQHEGHGAAYDPTAEDARFSQEVSEAQGAPSDEVQIDPPPHRQTCQTNRHTPDRVSASVREPVHGLVVPSFRSGALGVHSLDEHGYLVLGGFSGSGNQR